MDIPYPDVCCVWPRAPDDKLALTSDAAITHIACSLIYVDALHPTSPTLGFFFYHVAEQ
jgi:hypothetical protein